MSCRALGRKVEEAVLADIVALARAFGAQRLICEYIATEKNALVRELYPRLGLTEISRKGASVFTNYCLTMHASAPVWNSSKCCKALRQLRRSWANPTAERMSRIMSRKHNKPRSLALTVRTDCGRP
jgi:hypothetical protein